MGTRPLLGRIHRGTQERLSLYARLLKFELKWGPNIDIPLRRRVWLWRRGFTSESDALFDLDEENYREYLSTVQQERSMDIARKWASTVTNKLNGHLLFGSFPEHLPELYGLVEDGTLKRTSPVLDVPPWEDGSGTDSDERIPRYDAPEWVERYLAERGVLVLKPVYGRSGKGIIVCRDVPGSNEYDVNGERKTRDEFLELVGGLDEYLAAEFVQQAEYAERLFPDSTNTLRVLTFWDYETDEPFVGAAVQRIGSAESAPTDNFSGGGISADVGEDGTLSRGVRWVPSEGEARWFETHPTSGSRIAGATVPEWDAIREQILELASLYPYLRKVGWDILVTGEGTFKIIELNVKAGTRSIQAHGPLLRDPRIRRFYEHHDSL